MEHHEQVLQWGRHYLTSNGYALEKTAEIMLETPWSTLIKFATSKGCVYLKQTPPSISIESKLIQLLANKCQANVPRIIATNELLHCFLMNDAGQSLREYLKRDFQPKRLCQAIKQYAGIQRSTEDDIDAFLALGAPDWRLDKLPQGYERMISQETLLKDNGLTNKDLKMLRDLSLRFSAQCELLSQYQIPETIAIFDFNTNNVLIDMDSKQMTNIDWGEAVITHPFFSMHTYLHQAVIHHPVTESDETYYQLQETCLENWLDMAPRAQLLKAFDLAKKCWPIYSALSTFRLTDIIGLQAFKTFYANRPNKITNDLKTYILLES